MAFTHGKKTVLLVDANDLSQYFNQASIAATAETGETTNFASPGDAKTYVVGLTDGTVSMSGLFDGVASAIDSIFAATFAADTTRNTTLCIDGGLVLGAACKIAAAPQTSYEVTSPVADVVTTSAEFQVTGGVGHGRIIVPGTSVSATGNSSSVDWGALSNNGGIASLHVTANTRNGTHAIKVQHSVDNSVWVDLSPSFATTVASTVTSEIISIAPGTLVNRYIRFLWTVTGSTGAATISGGFARRAL